MLYRRVVRPLAFSLDAERAHHLAFGALRATFGAPLLGPALGSLVAPRAPELEVRCLGLSFPTPVGLAAGFDKDAIGHRALGRLGFGHVEVGTLTAHAQAGNPRPRMFRLPDDGAVINRMGFNNRGSADAVARLAGPRDVPLGVNIGKSKRTSEADAADDYATSARRVAPHADYLVVNVSSPNTPGLRDLQAVGRLAPILEAVAEAAGAVCAEPPPLLVKIAPDLADADVDAVADLALELGLAGIVATNTTISRAGLRSSEQLVERCGGGGLSGDPVRARALEVLRRLRARCGGELTLIAAGGITRVDDAWQRIVAGASLVQIYTGFVYGGPLTPRRLALGLGQRAREAGFATVQDAVGAR